MKFVKTGLMVLSLGLILSWAVTSPSQAKGELSGAEKKAVEDVVRTLLLEKEPDLIIKAAEEMQRRSQKADMEKGTKAVKENINAINHDANSPTLGNKRGDVTVVEFFDYQCGYCKVVYPDLLKLVKKDRNVKVVFKEYPILGSNSTYASKAALASVKQNKYLKFHEALMSSKRRLNKRNVMAIAKKVGLNIKQLEKDMKDSKIEKMIETNRSLGNKIGARGTPTFVIGGKLFPGAVPLDQMHQVIAEARSAKK